VFVNGLSADTSWRELKRHFSDSFVSLSQQRSVQRAQVALHPNGVPKGYGTVRFSNVEFATRAIRVLNGSQLKGRIIEVRLDRQAA